MFVMLSNTPHIKQTGGHHGHVVSKARICHFVKWQIRAYDTTGRALLSPRDRVQVSARASPAVVSPD